MAGKLVSPSFQLKTPKVVEFGIAFFTLKGTIFYTILSKTIKVRQGAYTVPYLLRGRNQIGSPRSVIEEEGFIELVDHSD